jgi:cell surface protein SprA
VVTGYKGSTSTRGQSSEETSRTRRSEWTPLVGWDATWSNGVRTTFNIRRSSSTTEDTKGTGSEKNSKSTSANFSVRHSFSAPEGMYIPLAGRTLKFKSSLSVQLDLSYESRIEATPSADNRIDSSRRIFSIAPKASYTFSKNVTGSADAKFEQNTDRKLKQTWRTIGLNASVLIHF